MRRTLAVLVTTAAFLVPAGAASADTTHANASCNNGKGGNYEWTGHVDNGKGNGKGRAAGVCTVSTDAPDTEPGTPVTEPDAPVTTPTTPTVPTPPPGAGEIS